MISALRLQSQYRFSPAPGTHARDNSMTMAWPNLDRGLSREEQLADEISKMRGLKELEDNADKQESLEDFLRWTNDTALDLPEVLRSRRRRDSEPSIIYTKWPSSRTRQRSSTGPHSPGELPSLSHTAPNRRSHNRSRKLNLLFSQGNARQELSRARSNPNSSRKISVTCTSGLGRAVRGTIKPLQRVTSLRLRRRHSTHGFPSSRPPLQGYRKASSLDYQRGLETSRTAHCSREQLQDRGPDFRKISNWANSVYHPSSTVDDPVHIHTSGPNNDPDTQHVKLDGSSTYSAPAIEALNDDVSSSCSGALDLLTAEEYLRQTAFDNLDEYRELARTL